MKRAYVPYDVARPYIETGDMLAYRASWLNPFSWAIATAGRSDICHIAAAGWLRNGQYGKFVPKLHLWVAEKVLAGGRLSLLSGQVDRWPRRIDVYRPASSAWIVRGPAGEMGNPSDDGWELARPDRRVYCSGSMIFDYVRSKADLTYNWQGVLAAAPNYLIGLRWFFRPSQDDEAEGRETEFCSECYAAAARQGFCDLVHNLADDQVLPGDLVRSPLMFYQFTLDRPTGSRNPPPLVEYLEAA